MIRDEYEWFVLKSLNSLLVFIGWLSDPGAGSLGFEGTQHCDTILRVALKKEQEIVVACPPRIVQSLRLDNYCRGNPEVGLSRPRLLDRYQA